MANLYAKTSKYLKEHGCSLVRQAKGSHEIWQNAEGNHFTLVKSGKAADTFRTACKQAGVEYPSFLQSRQKKKQQTPEP